MNVCRLSVASLQEVLACGVLLPLINQLSDPDYINQFVIWMVRKPRNQFGIRHQAQPVVQDQLMFVSLSPFVPALKDPRLQLQL